MLLRAVLELVLMVVVARSFWRVAGGVMEGLTGRRGYDPSQSRVPDHGVEMKRDPVCGVFVLPDRAITITVAGRPVYFCSTTCRDTYQKRNQAPSQSDRAHGRTA